MSGACKIRAYHGGSKCWESFLSGKHYPEKRGIGVVALFLERLQKGKKGHAEKCEEKHIKKTLNVKGHMH